MMMQAIMRPPRARYSGDQNPDLLKHPTNSWISAVGRLKPGARIEQARAELESVASEFVRTQLPAGAAPAPAAPSGPLQPISVRAWTRAVTISVGSCDRWRCCSAAWSARCC